MGKVAQNEVAVWFLISELAKCICVPPPVRCFPHVVGPVADRARILQMRPYLRMPDTRLPLPWQGGCLRPQVAACGDLACKKRGERIKTTLRIAVE